MSESEILNRVSPPGEVAQVVEHLFRHEAGRIVSTLARAFGVAQLKLAEDVVQEALARALQTWPYYGIPRSPPAWITHVARNLALDLIRRERVFRNRQGEIARFLEQGSADSSGEHSTSFANELGDDRLRMMFVCCHPRIPQEAQVALALKTLCGFSAAEIARAFLTSEAAIAKRLTRAKQRIREGRIAFEIPPRGELSHRLDAVLQTLYLLFNEGYKASRGERLVRAELCSEAIRLGTLLIGHPAGNVPRTHALLALMLFGAARLGARVDTDGNILRLREQDRSRWNHAMIGRGMFHLVQATAGSELSIYHLEAGIAACHCAARDDASTDWPQILALYDRLVAMDDSPVVALNRAVAVANVHGLGAGIETVEAIHNREQLNSYYLLYAVLGEFEAQRDNRQAAINAFRQSLELATMKSEQMYLSKRLRLLGIPSAAPRFSRRHPRRLVRRRQPRLRVFDRDSESGGGR